MSPEKMVARVVRHATTEKKPPVGQKEKKPHVRQTVMRERRVGRSMVRNCPLRKGLMGNNPKADGCGVGYQAETAKEEEGRKGWSLRSGGGGSVAEAQCEGMCAGDSRKKQHESTQETLSHNPHR
jgi:hypothetical protein